MVDSFGGLELGEEVAHRHELLGFRFADLLKGVFGFFHGAGASIVFGDAGRDI